MTDKEIVKALECCGGVGECQKCSLNNLGKGISLCIPHLTQSAVDLINRLQDEREALINGQETLQKTIVEQKAEIERLEAEKRKLKNEMSYMSSPNTIGDRHEMGCW